MLINYPYEEHLHLFPALFPPIKIIVWIPQAFQRKQFRPQIQIFEIPENEEEEPITDEEVL